VYAKNLVKKMGLSSRVSFLEKISGEDLVLEYNKAEVMVVPSLFEGFGLPALEAMASGTAVIASDAGALPEVVGSSEDATGILVPSGNDSALKDAILKLLGDGNLRATLVKNARMRAEKFFSWEQAGEKLEKIYQEQMKRRD